MNVYFGYTLAILIVALLAVIARLLSKPVQLRAGATALMLPDNNIVLLHRIPIHHCWSLEEIEKAMNTYKVKIEATPWYGLVNHVFLPDDGSGRGGIEALSLDKQTTQRLQEALR